MRPVGPAASTSRKMAHSPAASGVTHPPRNQLAFGAWCHRHQEAALTAWSQDLFDVVFGGLRVLVETLGESCGDPL